MQKSHYNRSVAKYGIAYDRENGKTLQENFQHKATHGDQHQKTNGWFFTFIHGLKENYGYQEKVETNQQKKASDNGDQSNPYIGILPEISDE